MEASPKVSVIITIYNREKYLETCVRSLFEQTLDDIEYVFVNDASTDHSMDVLRRVAGEYPAREPWLKIIDLKVNGGVSNARRLGMASVTGQYVIHADSDDWVDLDMYERLYQKALETRADVVGCNITHEYLQHQSVLRQPYADTVEENTRRLIDGRIHPSLCTSLARRELIEQRRIVFPEGLNMGEDLFFNLQLFLYASRIVSIDFAPYHYRHTDDSSSFRHNRKTIDSGINICRKMETLLKETGHYDRYARDLEYRKFAMKLSLVVHFDNQDDYQYWLTVFPETHRHIWQFRQLSWKLRLELWLAAHHLFPLARAFKRLLDWQHRLRRL